MKIWGWWQSLSRGMEKRKNNIDGEIFTLLCYNYPMEQNIKIEFKRSTIENLEDFSFILKKDINTMLEEALEQYFQSEQEKLIEKNKEDESAMTNLNYDEFWDGLDIG